MTGKNVFPWAYFNFSANASDYSDYVTEAVHDLVHDIGTESEYYFDSSPAELPSDDAVLPSGHQFPDSTTLPTWQGSITFR